LLGGSLACSYSADDFDGGFITIADPAGCFVWKAEL
jgi:hypothetical protein